MPFSACPPIGKAGRLLRHFASLQAAHASGFSLRPAMCAPSVQVVLFATGGILKRITWQKEIHAVYGYYTAVFKTKLQIARAPVNSIFYYPKIPSDKCP